jgi:hypothetical protein
MSNENLKPCPLCRCAAELGSGSIMCTGCGLQLKATRSSSIEGLICQWNNRPDVDYLQRSNDALRDKVKPTESISCSHDFEHVYSMMQYIKNPDMREMIHNNMIRTIAALILKNKKLLAVNFDQAEQRLSFIVCIQQKPFKDGEYDIMDAKQPGDT